MTDSGLAAALIRERFGPLPEAIRERPDIAARRLKLRDETMHPTPHAFQPRDTADDITDDVLALRRWKWSGRQIAAVLCVDEKRVTELLRRARVA